MLHRAHILSSRSSNSNQSNQVQIFSGYPFLVDEAASQFRNNQYYPRDLLDRNDANHSKAMKLRKHHIDEEGMTMFAEAAEALTPGQVMPGHKYSLPIVGS
jgi:hypothetical protein